MLYWVWEFALQNHVSPWCCIAGESLFWGFWCPLNAALGAVIIPGVMVFPKFCAAWQSYRMAMLFLYACVSNLGGWWFSSLPQWGVLVSSTSHCSFQSVFISIVTSGAYGTSHQLRYPCIWFFKTQQDNQIIPRCIHRLLRYFCLPTLRTLWVCL